MNEVMKDYTDHTIFKLHDDGSMLGYVLRDAKPHLNAGKMSCRVVISSPRVDRSRDIVTTKGMDLKEHKSNPVVLLNHNKLHPIGYAEDPLGSYTVRLDSSDRLIAETYFTKHAEIGEQAFRLVENKVLRGASIGFIPGIVEKCSAGGNHYQTGKLIEYSHLAIPDNPDALVLAIEKGFGGKPLLPDLKAILQPLVPSRPAMVTSGFSPAPSSDDDTALRDLVSKAMDDTLLGGGGNDPMMPPDAQQPQDDMGDQEMPHEEVVNRATLEIGISMLKQAIAGAVDPKQAMKKVVAMFSAHNDLKDSGDDGAMPDLDEEPDPTDLDEDGVDDAEEDSELDDSDSGDEETGSKKKPSFAKSYDAWTPEGAAVITKAYKFLTALANRPTRPLTKRQKQLQWVSQEKTEAMAKAIMDEMRAHVRPVEKMIADEAMVKKQSDEWSEWGMNGDVLPLLERKVSDIQSTLYSLTGR